MITLLAKIFVKEDMADSKKREVYGMLCGIVGIFLNVLLFAGKFIAGLISNSIAITADAFNNLSDAASSVVTLVGFKLAGQKADKEHPFGHGRMEYLAGLAVSALILIMAFELIKDAIDKIIHPTDTTWSMLVIAILLVSILVKLYMAFYNTRVGKRFDSAAIRAVATDSLSDIVATTVVILSNIIQHVWGLHVDGFCGIIVGAMVFMAGVSAAKDLIDPLLGVPPTEEFVRQIADIVLNFDKEHVVGLHDLMVHDYGPGRCFVSLHAEVPAEGNIVEIHDVIDNLEHKIGEEMNCMATIHMDPIATQDIRVKNLRAEVAELATELNPEITIHDFRVVWGESHNNLVFDMVLPYNDKRSDVQIKEQLQALIHEKIGENYVIVVQVDRPYVK